MNIVAFLVNLFSLDFNYVNHSERETKQEVCRLDMFGGDTNAFWACKTQFALQSNWFPSPKAELHTYLTWNGLGGFWRNGAVLEPMVNFMAYANHTRFKSVLRNSHRNLKSLLSAYLPYPSYDDLAWYGLSYVRIYEVLHWDRFLETAIDLFQWSWRIGWDGTGACDGGFWFDYRKTWNKQTITNVLMMQLGAKLYRITNNTETLKKVNQIYTFLVKNKVINTTSYLLSGGMRSNCTPDSSEAFTYNSGVMIGAFVEMSRIYENENHLDLAIKLADAILIHRTNNNGVLTEVCDPEAECDDDQKMFKGIFVRNLRYLMDTLKTREEKRNYMHAQYALHCPWLKFKVRRTLPTHVFISNVLRRDMHFYACHHAIDIITASPDLLKAKSKREKYQRFLELNVKSVITSSICDTDPISECDIVFKDGPPYFNVTGPVFAPSWSGPFTVGKPIQQTSALELFVASILLGTKCSGDMCSYDPPYPTSGNT